MEFICGVCSKLFIDMPCRKRKFCSKECNKKAPRVWLIGNNYGFKKNTPSHNKGLKRWWDSPSQWRKGDNKAEKHPNWKGGRSRSYKTGYYSIEYKFWRKSVFERDTYTCIKCKRIGGYLTAHHIKSFALFPGLRFVIDNGQTLCGECHKQTDNYGGRVKIVRKLNELNSVEVPQG